MVDEKSGKRRWGTDQRLEFIEFRLFWDGVLQRIDIMDRFGVSPVQASADIALYREVAPDNLDYDPSQKRFLASPGFTPRVMTPNPDRFLVQLKAVADGVIDTGETNLGQTPPLDAMPVPHRRVDPFLLRGVLFAIRGGQGLSIRYHSMNASRKLAQWRDFTPHALAFDGLRWHVRAYCHLEDRFKDFILSRILELGGIVAAGKPAGDDVEWNERFDVILIPNPALSPEQRETIAWDYGMENGRLRMSVRRALLYYFNKRLRLDLSESDNPKEAPVVIENRAAFLTNL